MRKMNNGKLVLMSIMVLCLWLAISCGGRSSNVEEDMKSDTSTKVDTHVAEDTYVAKDTNVARDTKVGEDIPVKKDTGVGHDTSVEDASEDDTSKEDTSEEDTRVEDADEGDLVKTDAPIADIVSDQVIADLVSDQEKEDSVADQVTEDVTGDTTGTRKCTDTMFENYDNCWTTTCEPTYDTCITACAGNDVCEGECEDEALACDDTCWETHVSVDCRTAVDAWLTCRDACDDCFTALDTLSIKFTTANCKSEYEAVYGPLPAVPQCGLGKYCEDCETDCPNSGICFDFSASTKDGFCTADCSTNAAVCGTATGMTCVDNTWDTAAPIEPAKVCEFVNPNCTFGKVCPFQDLFTSTCGASFLKNNFEFICSKLCYQNVANPTTCKADSDCTNTGGITMKCEVVEFQSGDKCACNPQ